MTVRRLPWMVLVLLGACNGGGGGGDEPGPGPGPGPGATVLGPTAGGTSRSGGGRGAGELQITSVSGDVQVTTAAALPAAPPALTAVDPALGANPRTIDADATLTPDGNDEIPGDGPGPATGLWVKPGAVLTVQSTLNDWAYLHFSGGVRLDGGLRLPFRSAPAASRGFLRIGAASVAVAATSSIQMWGEDDVLGQGGDGGSLVIEATDGVAFAGSIDARGGAGATFGGDGGEVLIRGPSGDLLFSGDADVRGGAATAGPGGDGGSVNLGLSCATGEGTGAVELSGSVDARGGAGTDLAGGGDGGRIDAQSCGGALVVSANLDARGADGAAGDAGDGGVVSLGAFGGILHFTGAALAGGGAGAGAWGGGGGGTLELESHDLASTAPALLGARVLYPGLDVTGGDGASGGSGGDLTISVWKVGEADATSGLLVVADVEVLSTSGSPGTVAGGRAGALWVASLPANDAPDSDAGAVTVEPLLQANGGRATAAGGEGGEAYELYVDGDAVSVAAVSADGGVPGAGGPGGGGGAVWITATGGPSSLGGAISVKGAAGTPAGATGSVTVDGAQKALVDGVFVP